MNIEVILQFFIDVGNGDSKLRQLIVAVNDDRIRLVENQLIFTLAGLHEFLDDRRSMSYISFRKLVYSSTLNDSLKDYGLKVELHQNFDKVDENIYCLSAAARPE